MEFKAYYQSMSAFYNLGTVTAEDEDEALRIARAKWRSDFRDSINLIKVQRIK